MANLEFEYDEIKGYYDIFGSGGKLSRTEGLDIQILMSLLVDSRASDSEIPIKNLQRGWSGNIYTNSNPDYQIGCKQWIYTEQGRNSNEVAEKIRDTILNDGIQWLIEDGYAESFEVDLTVSYTNIEIDLYIKIDENNTEQKKIILWQNTGS